MIIECDRCYSRYRYDETRFAGKPSKKVRCTKCLAIFEIFNTGSVDSLPSAVGSATASSEETIHRLSDDERRAPVETTKKVRMPTAERREGALSMPEGYRVSLAVIAGPEAGRIYEIDKPRVVIGRADADVNVDDPEVSRQHAALEIFGEKVTLVDLGSTNGTLVADEPIREAPLENQSEFSIGGSTLMLILSAKG